MNVIVLLGAPGSGKGTIASRLSRLHPVRHISSGDLLRAAVQQADTPTARAGVRLAAAVWLEVPEPVLISRLAGRRVCGACAANYHVVNLPPRAAGICDACGGALIQREDDRPERVANRLVVYREQTAALVDWYASRDLLIRIEADGDAGETAARVARAVLA